ncbi:MAG: ABC transporter permease [Actinobacteria bacterium]|nr:ABC transporter permease [Actinomycetota bacterium]
MLKASLKSLWARKVSLVLSALAIVLGTAFVGGSFTFTDMLNSAFQGIVSGASADVNVQPKNAFESMNSSSDATLTPAAIDKIRSVDGVQAAYGTVGANDAYLLGTNGKPMAAGAPGVATNYIDAPAAGGQVGLLMKSGRAPNGPNEVVIDPGSLEKLGAELGQTVRIYTSGKQGVVTKTIVGTALYGSKGSTGGATYAIFDTPTAQQLFLDGKDAYQGAWVVTKPGADPKTVAGAVASALPSGWEAKTGQEIGEKVNEMMASGLKFITYMLLVFAGIALLVGSFLIVNTFTILVAQRARELALFRAMGASRGQVRLSVMIEALVLGVVGSTLGLLLGFGLAFGISKLFGSIGLDISGAQMRLTLPAVAWTYAVGVLVTLVAALIPALRASRVPPVAAMSGDFATGQSGLGWRAALGGALTALGAAALLYGLFGDPPFNRMYAVAGGAVGVLLGAAAISPILGAPVIWLLGRIGNGVFGATGRLAEVNSARNPRRTAITASALMVGLALVTALGVVASSVNASTSKIIESNLRSDYIVQTMNGMPFSPAIGDDMAKVDGVDQVYRLRYTPAQLQGDNAYLGAMAPNAFDKIMKQSMATGNLADFRTNTVLLRDEYAAEKGWAVGTKLTSELNNQTVPLTVVGTFTMDRNASLGNVLTTIDTLDAVGMRTMDSFLAIDVKPGADKAAVQSKLDKILEPLPLVSVQDQKAYADAQAQGINMVLYIFYALLGLAIIIAIFGIVNTLGLSIIERTREIGLLRAVGLNKAQVRRMIVLESTTISLLGAALGIGLGLLFGLALQRAMADQGLDQLALPWPQLGISVVVALIVGVLAGLWPAVRATNLDVLKAITTQ